VTDRQKSIEPLTTKSAPAPELEAKGARTNFKGAPSCPLPAGAGAVQNTSHWPFLICLKSGLDSFQRDSTWSCLKKDKQPQREESASTYINPRSFMKISNLFLNC